MNALNRSADMSARFYFLGDIFRRYPPTTMDNSPRPTSARRSFSPAGWRTAATTGIIFIDLRDRYGYTQTVYDPPFRIGVEACGYLPFNLDGRTHGSVRALPEGQNNRTFRPAKSKSSFPRLRFWLNPKTPPFVLDDYCEANEEVRYKHRYLDLRRRKTLSIAVRSRK